MNREMVIEGKRMHAKLRRKRREEEEEIKRIQK